MFQDSGNIHLLFGKKSINIKYKIPYYARISIILIDPDNTIVNKVNFIKESTSIYFLAKLSKTTSSEWNTSSGHYKLECWHISGDSKELKFT
ncbi:hypothetical protein CLV59_108347, partial [Chitinophaga dinghuensis]